MRIILKGDGELKLRLKSLERRMLTRTILTQISGAAVSMIVTRTLQGKDKTGQEFSKYSRDYLEAKKERGGKFFSGKVNLSDKDHMLSNLTFRVEGDNRAYLYFPKAIERSKAISHIFGDRSRKLPKRDFFGITPTEEMKLSKMLERHLDNESTRHK